MELTDMVVLDWAALKTLAVLVATKILVGILLLVVTYALGRLASSAAVAALKRASGRSETLAPIVQKGATIVAVSVGVVMALDQAGIDVATIIAGAGVLGLAVGFGAQSLVKDLISGFFLLLEDVIRVGDIAEVGGRTGTIEEVGLRMTKLRAISGQLWYIPNGEISTVGNFNRDWSRAIVEVGLAYEQDLARGLAALQDVGNAYAMERQDMVLEPPEAQGALGLNSSDVGIRLLVKVQPNRMWEVERELRQRLKERFDRDKIEIPFPRQVVYLRQEEGAAVTITKDSREKDSASE